MEYIEWRAVLAADSQKNDFKHLIISTLECIKHQNTWSIFLLIHAVFFA